MNVSIALCTYNAGGYLSEQLNSLIAQTRQPDEIVVFDDNSEDGTWSILRDYEERYPDFFEIYQNESNIGVTKNYEACIGACSGDAIAICDQDDIWDEKKIESQTAHILLSEPMLVHHNSQIVNENMEPIQDYWKSFGYSEAEVLGMDAYFDHLIDRFSIPGHTMLISDRLKEYILPIPDCFAYDLYISLIASLFGEIYAIPDRLVNWRHHETAFANRPAFGILDQVQQIRQSILRESIHDERIVQWEVLGEKVDEYKLDLTVNPRHVHDLINERYEYDSARAKIYDADSSVVERMEGWVKNIYRGRYWRVKGRQPLQLIVKDLIGCMVKSIQRTD